MASDVRSLMDHIEATYLATLAALGLPLSIWGLRLIHPFACDILGLIETAAYQYKRGGFFYDG